MSIDIISIPSDGVLHPVGAIPNADALPFVVGRDLVSTVTAICPYPVQMTHVLAYQSPGGEKKALESVQLKRMELTVRICVSTLVEERDIDQGKKPL